MHGSSPQRKAGYFIEARLNCLFDSTDAMPNSPHDDLRTELAATAARLIAEDGLDYATAKQKAAASLFGTSGSARRALPDNEAVEIQLRRYLTTFVPEHAQRLRAQRLFALQLMQRLAQFQPHLTGAVLNGTATQHSDIHLSLYVDSVKDVELFLLDQGQAFEVSEADPAPGAPLETLFFVTRAPRASGLTDALGVVLDVYDAHAMRVAPKRRGNADDLHPVEAAGRANAAMLERLLAEA